MIYKQDVIQIINRQIYDCQHERRVAESYNDTETISNMNTLEHMLEGLRDEVDQIQDEPDFLDPEDYMDLDYDEKEMEYHLRVRGE